MYILKWKLAVWILSSFLGVSGAALAQSSALPAASRAVLAPAGEPGAAMEIRGVVLGRDGKPQAGVNIYAYHTDARGLYNTHGNREPRLRGRVRTDDAGRFELRSIRPASYPNNGPAAHVHLEVTPPGASVQYFEIMFDDDRKVSAEMRQESARGGAARVIELTKSSDGVWKGTVELRLK
jgi:protocatechuate 3,4-dioxygenase beta subunit